MTRIEDNEPDGEMSAEQQAIADSLSAEMVQAIDSALLAQAHQKYRKVAMIVGTVMLESATNVPGLPDLYYASRVKELVKSGKLIAEGNLNFMRYSEVRLP